MGKRWGWIGVILAFWSGAQAAGSDCSQRFVLLAHPTPDTAARISERLTEAGLSVRIALDYPITRRTIEQSPPQVLVLDHRIQMEREGPNLVDLFYEHEPFGATRPIVVNGPYPGMAKGTDYPKDTEFLDVATSYLILKAVQQRLNPKTSQQRFLATAP